MPRTSVTLDTETESILADLTGEDGPFEARSEAVRECIREYARMHQQIEELERENARLDTRVRKLIDTREEHQELVAFVEQEQSLAGRREDRERAWDQAAIWTKFKWHVFGRPAETGAKP